MTRHSALAASFSRLLAGPLVRRPLLMCSLPALAGDLALLGSVHRRKTAILFCHVSSSRSFERDLARRTLGLQPMCHGIPHNYQQHKYLGNYFPSGCRTPFVQWKNNSTRATTKACSATCRRETEGND